MKGILRQYNMSGQEGIDRLLSAEQEATDILAKAKKGEENSQRKTVFGTPS